MKVVVSDYGVKLNILRSLRARGCEVVVVPDDASAEEILAHDPDGDSLNRAESLTSSARLRNSL